MPEKIQPIYKTDMHEINSRLSVIQRLIDNLDTRTKNLESIAISETEYITYSELGEIGDLVDKM